MTYSVSFAKPALKSLQKMDKSDAKVIISWVNKNLEETDNPRKQGKQLKGNHGAFWRYRIGDYCLLCQIIDGRLVIIVVVIGHHREIYK